MKKYLLIIIPSLYIVCGCGDKNTTPGYDKGPLLVNEADNIIVPAYSNLKSKTDSLVSFTEAFVASPTGENLASLQNQWKATAIAWEYCQIFSFGPADDISLENNVYYWPTNVGLIEGEIYGTSDINATYADALGVSRKGLPAIEYLIFQYQSSDSVVAKYTTDDKAERRKAYLSVLSGNVAKNAASVLDAWENGYRNTFVQNTGNDISSSITMLTNQVLANLEVVINKKLGVPLGKKTNGAIQTGSIETPYAKISISSMATSINMLTQVFTGKDGAGYDDYLLALNIKSDDNLPLNEKIVTQLGNFKDAVNAISEPYTGTLQTNPQLVENAWTEGKKLLILMKVDMTSALGITVTFSDNDGD